MGDSVIQNGRAVTLNNSKILSSRSNKKTKKQLDKPKKQTDVIVERASNKKFGDGVVESAKEHLKESPTYFAFYKSDKDKNARPDAVMLYDFNRVELQDGPDYYHASYVNGCSRNNQYILAQAPFTKETLADFMRMVSQSKPDAIVLMGQHDSDDFKTLFSQKEGKDGKLSWKIEEEKDKGGSAEGLLDIYQLTVAKYKTKVFCINGWTSDKDYPKEMIDMQDKIRKQVSLSHKSYLMIVCKDGATRSGLFALLDIESERIKIKNKVKLTETIRFLRQQRSNCFDTFEMFDAATNLITELCKKYP